MLSVAIPVAIYIARGLRALHVDGRRVDAFHLLLVVLTAVVLVAAVLLVGRRDVDGQLRC